MGAPKEYAGAGTMRMLLGGWGCQCGAEMRHLMSSRLNGRRNGGGAPWLNGTNTPTLPQPHSATRSLRTVQSWGAHPCSFLRASTASTTRLGTCSPSHARRRLAPPTPPHPTITTTAAAPPPHSLLLLQDQLGGPEARQQLPPVVLEPQQVIAQRAQLPRVHLLEARLQRLGALRAGEGYICVLKQG